MMKYQQAKETGMRRRQRMKTEGKALGKLGRENMNLVKKKIHVKEKDKKNGGTAEKKAVDNS